ncbi:hypothetical protein [Sphingomonas colocasiae]|uniref:Uncharacterized protein n=1 Tax=Sphingomonas colocasiae TaxID=1848973 RepID=A0ABS7PMQ6_9SPHN|nr:hypothetical protein [Sphingomonas colocasiae]MBY8822597.1 hypothetical protein [Sphingomonas colocasiae]
MGADEILALEIWKALRGRPISEAEIVGEVADYRRCLDAVRATAPQEDPD